VEELQQTIHDLRAEILRLHEQMQEERADWRDEVAARFEAAMVAATRSVSAPNFFKWTEDLAVASYDAADAHIAEGQRRRAQEGRPQPILQSLYTELLDEVDTKIPGETRHETARRWLAEHRQRPAQAGKPEVKS
jgi:hypothetical protein